jgi:sporulation protein YlmC with PRC-barrel domain
MKRNLQIIISASAALVLACSARAQDASNLKADGPDFTHDGARHWQRPDRLNGAAKASDIIGMRVDNYQDEKLGKVQDLAVDVESGRIVQVIVSTGGFMGMDKTLTAVPPEALRCDDSRKVLQLDVSMEKFNAAPKFDNSRWSEETQSNRLTEVYGYYGEQPYFVADTIGDQGAPSADLHGASADTLPRNMNGSINADGSRAVDKVHNVEAVRNFEETNNWISTRNPDGTWSRKYYARTEGANNSCPRLGYIERTDKLMGTSVRNLQNEKLGKVENFIVDLSSGRILAVIISSGAFMGMDGELSAVPPAAFRFNAEHDTLQLDASREMLSSAPHFKADQWPDFRQPGYSMGVYSAYKVDPYFTTDMNAGPDNTARNDRALTPLDQGNSQADLDTTAQIRKDILADDGMSVNAKNVKIITRDGRVTLRGVVNSDEERHNVGEIANHVAHSGNVDNQLAVAAGTPDHN